MSVCVFIAADTPLEEVKNPHYKTLSINEAEQIGMDIPESLLESGVNPDKPNVILWSDTKLIIENGKAFDGDLDDDFALLHMDNVGHYSDKKYGVYIEWNYPTDGRAKKILKYIQKVLKKTDNIEMWCVWLSDYEPPIIKTTIINAQALEPKHIIELDTSELWNNPDKDVPTYYCLRIIA